MEIRGSTVTSSLSETSLTETVRPRRGRRGQPHPIRGKPGQPVVERAKSPVIVSASPVLKTTPGREMEGKDTADTPPAKKTPGAVRTSKITPKQPPRKKKQ
ncbi:hypothetical protein OESDEN_14297 [Oesophagostomum dentatum]|uniref:Uncharacterized protein n=1 Tax=Oesophagostomum dentatum TaxID=61180 RepID=A0A0B1SPZ4_OESDE|nr:hypothetical protein OESDEN_14297 [Oesophagostomum dentatum]